MGIGAKTRSVCLPALVTTFAGTTFGDRSRGKSARPALRAPLVRAALLGSDRTAHLAAVYETTQRSAWVFTPLVVDGACLGSLAVSWPESGPTPRTVPDRPRPGRVDCHPASPRHFRRPGLTARRTWRR